MSRNSLSLVAVVSMLGCAHTTPGAAPHEMSVAQHEAAAQKEEQTATEHQNQYNPNAVSGQVRCSAARGTRQIDVDTGACWTSATNPTTQHLRMAEEHRKHAADHRTGSAALQAAETHACVGITPADRDISPFERVEDITSVQPYRVSEQRAKTAVSTLRGAVVSFRAVEGMTTEWLQRLVDCHLARNAALGHVVPEMPDCPLVPKEVQAQVSSTGNGFAVTIQSSDAAVAKEILARAQRLTQHGAVGQQ